MPITGKLFGDDISKEIKNCDNLASLGREPSTFYTGNFRSHGRYPRRGAYTTSQSSFYANRYQPYSQRGQPNYRVNSVRSKPSKKATAIVRFI